MLITGCQNQKFANLHIDSFGKSPAKDYTHILSRANYALGAARA